MSNPDDDTDVPSGFNDDAEMERTPSRTSDTRPRATTYMADAVYNKLVQLQALV